MVKSDKSATSVGISLKLLPTLEARLVEYRKLRSYVYNGNSVRYNYKRPHNAAEVTWVKFLDSEIRKLLAIIRAARSGKASQVNNLESVW